MGECSTQPLLTVIIPVYKAVETLGPCLESILSQGMQALQVVLIVDGSPDESGLLCDEWAKKDGRIQVIHQPNRGASAARNAGLAAAKGRYITFVDADDRLLPGLYARALPALEENGLYLFGVEFSDGTVPWPLESARYESLSQLAPQLEKLVVDTGTLAVLYNKIYPARLLQGQRFDERLAINEDLELNLRVLADPALEAIQVDGTPGYWYQAEAPGSLSRRMRTDLLEAEEATRPAYRAFLQAAGLDEAGQQRLLAARRTNVCTAQYGLLTGPGKVAFGRRLALLRQIWADKPARARLRKRAQTDPNRLLALPYRVCFALNSPALLAVFCQLKGLREPST